MRNNAAPSRIICSRSSCARLNLHCPHLFVDEFTEITLAKQIQPQPPSSAPTTPAPATRPASDEHPLMNICTSEPPPAGVLSAACGLRASLCVYVPIGTRLVDKAPSSPPPSITALFPMHFYYAQFARCYSLVFLLAALDSGSYCASVSTHRARELDRLPAIVASSRLQTKTTTLRRSLFPGHERRRIKWTQTHAAAKSAKPYAALHCHRPSPCSRFYGSFPGVPSNFQKPSATRSPNAATSSTRTFHCSGSTLLPIHLESAKQSIGTDGDSYGRRGWAVVVKS